MQRKLMPGQYLARGFAQPNGTHGKDEKGHIENKTNQKHHPTRYQSDLGPRKELFKCTRRLRIQIHFEIPTKRQKSEEPDVISAQAPANCLPDTDGEMRRQQIR